MIFKLSKSSKCGQRECWHPTTNTQFIDVPMPLILIESVEVLILIPQVHNSRAIWRTARHCANLKRVRQDGDLSSMETHLKVKHRFF